MAEKKATKKVQKKAGVKKSAPQAKAGAQMISKDKATEMYGKRNKAAGLDKEVHPLAMWGFIASVGTFLIAFIPFLNILAFLLPPTGIVLSAVGLSKIKKEPAKFRGRGFALAGIIVGAAIIVLGTLAIVGFVIYFANNAGELATMMPPAI